jgi:hypothetical protein
VNISNGNYNSNTEITRRFLTKKLVFDEKSKKHGHGRGKNN